MRLGAAMLVLAACSAPARQQPTSNAGASAPAADAGPPATQVCWSAPDVGAHCYATDVECEDNARLAALMYGLAGAPRCDRIPE